MVIIFTSLLFVGAFFAALATITLMLEVYGGRAAAALRMEHQPVKDLWLSESGYQRVREGRTGTSWRSVPAPRATQHAA